MPRKIEGAIRLPKGKGLLKAGDERKLAEADLSKDALRRLQDRGAITGFASEDVEEPDETPIRSLKDFLADKDQAEVERLASADERSSARPIYEARLNELKGETP